MAAAQLAILTGTNLRNHPRGSEKQSSNTVDRGVLAGENDKIAAIGNRLCKSW
jgi:hypothetical protein